MANKEQLAKYWELGWIAFPISLTWNAQREKKELQAPKGWQNLDMEAAKALPPRTAFAIQTGSGSGIIVLDIDDVDGWQRFLEEKGREAPETVTARSQRGGLHYYFNWTDSIADLKSTSALLGGCADIRNKGGMIIAPPSTFHVPGENDPRCYSWLEGNSPWDFNLAEMPDWLVQALRESGGGSTNATKRAGQQAHVQLDGPDSMTTPNVVKEFIAEFYAIMPGTVGGTKWLGDGAGYAVSTNVLDCCFKKAPHKSNRQFIFVSASGDMSRRCHDGECMDKKWGQRKVPVDVMQAIQALFTSKVVVDPELVELARKEAADHLNDAVPGNDAMTMTLKPDSSGFEGALTKFIGRERCSQCGKGTLMATTSSTGLVIACNNVGCPFKMPASGGIAVPTDKYANLGKYFVIIQQVNNTTINNHIYGSVDTDIGPYEFVKDNVQFFESEKLNRCFLLSLTGTGVHIADFIRTYYADADIVYVNDADKNGPWMAFVDGRWTAMDLTDIADRLLSANDFRGHFDRAWAHYAELNEQRKAKRISETLVAIGEPFKLKGYMSLTKRFFAKRSAEFLKLRDSKRNLIGFENGILDLDAWTSGRTDYFRVSRPDDYVTMSTGYDFNHAEAHDEEIKERIMEVLSQIQPEVENRDFLLKFLSSMLSGEIKDAKLMFFEGNGANGKSMLTKSVVSILGDYGAMAKTEIFTQKAGSDARAPNSAIAKIARARGVFCEEIEVGAKINTKVMKELTGANKISNRAVYAREEITIEPQWHFAMCVNHAPSFADDKSDGATRRIDILPFTSSFIVSGEVDVDNHVYRADPNMAERLGGEWRNSFLGILLDYYKKFRAEGLERPSEVQERREDYIARNNPLWDFLQESLVESANSTVSLDDILTRFRRWFIRTYGEAALQVQYPEYVESQTHRRGGKLKVIREIGGKLRQMGKSVGLVFGKNTCLLGHDWAPERAVQIAENRAGTKAGTVERFQSQGVGSGEYLEWNLVTQVSREKGGECARSVTSLIEENIARAEWMVETRMNVHGAVMERDWMRNATASVLAGVVAEAQVKYYLCRGIESDWRQLTLESTEVSASTSADIRSLFIEPGDSIAAAVKLIKKLTNTEYWEAPTTNFRMRTVDHGEVTGRVDFHARSGRNILSFNPETGKKLLQPRPGWNSFTLSSPGRVEQGHNALAIKTGSESGLVVVDVDDVPAWNRMLTQMERTEPDTATQISQSGGKHFFFKWDDRMIGLKSSAKALPGVDVRATGGMILVCPSRALRPDGTIAEYRWLPGKALVGADAVEAALMPQWLFDALVKGQGRTASHGGAGRTGESRETLPVPVTLGDFVLNKFQMVATRLKGIRRESAGVYTIVTDVKDCPIKKGTHAGNHQFLSVRDGTMTRMCYDVDCMRDRMKKKTSKIPTALLSELKTMFSEDQDDNQHIVTTAVSEDMASGLAVECFTGFGKDNKDMSVVHDKSTNEIYGGLLSLLGNRACPDCGHRIEGAVGPEGYYARCQCGFRHPSEAAIPIPKALNALAQYFVMGSNNIIIMGNGNSVTIGESLGVDDSKRLFGNNEVAVVDDVEHNNLILQALNGKDTDIAFLFAHQFRSRIVFASDGEWYMFRETRWTSVGPAEVAAWLFSDEFMGLFYKAREVYEKLDDEDVPRKLKRIDATLDVLRTATARTSIVSTCATPELLKDPTGKFLSMLDSRSDLLGFENGVYDLERDEFRAGSPEDYVMMSVGYDYDDTRTDDYEHVMRFFDQIFPDNAVREYALRYLASTLDGRVKDQTFHFAHGRGGNGKTMVTSLMAATLGAYASEAKPALICGTSPASADGANPELASLVNKRFVYLEELLDGEKLNEQMFKLLSGGRSFKYRPLYKGAREARITFKLFLACNHLPLFHGDDEAMRRRIELIPFQSSFKKHAAECDTEKHEYVRDDTLADRFEGWRGTFMGILLAYYAKYRSEGLGSIPPAMVKARKMYIDKNDPSGVVARYISTRLRQGDGGIANDTLIADFKRWVGEERVQFPLEGKTTLLERFDDLLLGAVQIAEIRAGKKAGTVRRFQSQGVRTGGYGGWNIVAD
ncbi:hypothetical protein HDU93_004812 [Gonapodya sp. JEL0774]|nr:hypothetical protein HDU93_004812 [Gonapodya sp. JEL0774]